MINKYNPKYKRDKSKDKFEKIKKEAQEKFEKEHTFKPNINYNFSNNRDKSDENKDEFYRRLSVPKTIQVNKRLQEKEYYDKQRMKEECTFQPNIEDNTPYKKSNTSNIEPEKISNRLFKLAEQLKEKREKLKREHEEKSVNSHTYAPHISDKSKSLLIKYENQPPIYERVIINKII
jgi:hypothetical protein